MTTRQEIFEFVCVVCKNKLCAKGNHIFGFPMVHPKREVCVCEECFKDMTPLEPQHLRDMLSKVVTSRRLVRDN